MKVFETNLKALQVVDVGTRFGHWESKKKKFEILELFPVGSV